MAFSKKIRVLFLSIMLLFTYTSTVFGANEYTIVNSDAQGTMLALKDASPSIIFGNYRSVGDDLSLYQSEYEQSGSILTQYSLLTSSQGIVMPYFEISINPDKNDPATEVAVYGKNFFSQISPKATTAMMKEFMRLVNLAVKASEYKVMGYDATKYLISEVDDTIIGVSFIYSAGDSFTFICYMNLPETSLYTGNTYTTEEINAQIAYEKSRIINTWFMHDTQTTAPFEITDTKWEISWEILSWVEGKSEYKLTVLDAEDNVVKTITAGLDNVLGSEIIDGPGNYKLKSEVKYGNWYVTIKNISE